MWSELNIFIKNLLNRSRIISVLILTVIVSANLYPQVQITLQKPPVQQLEVKNLWNVQINNPRNINEKVYLIARVRADSAQNELAVFRSGDFNLPQGLQRLDNRRIKVTKEEFKDDKTERIYKQTGNFPNGHYDITVELYKSLDDSKLSESSVKHQILNIYTATAEEQVQSFVSFYGNAYLQAYKSNYKGIGQDIPKQYLMGNLNATVEFGIVPVDIRSHISTINSDLRQSSDQFTIAFNDERFINNMRNRISNVIAKETGIKQEKFGDARNKLKKLNDINTLLDNQNVESKLENAGSLDSVEKQIKELNLAEAAQKIDQQRKAIIGRMNKLNYDSRKKKIKTQIQIYQEIEYEAKAKEKDRKRKIDSLQNALIELEKKKQEAIEKNNKDLLKIQKLYKKQRKLEKLQQKKTKIINLVEKKERLEKLIEQKEKLEKYKEKLEESGGLEQIRSFDLNSLNDKEVLKQELIKRGMLSTGQKLLYGFEELSVGTIYPYYSPLILNGLKVNGLGIEWSPGLFYMAFTGGSSKRPRFSLKDRVVEYDQRMLAGKIGIGKKFKNHFYLTALHAIDDRNSLERNDTINFPKSNFILGTDIGLSFFKGRFKLQGEFAGSEFKNDNLAYEIPLNSRLNKWIPGFLKPNISSRYGLAYDVRGAIKLFKDNTIISGFVRNIEPAYNSFGAPNLRRGLFTYNAGISQHLFEKKIKVRIFRKNERTTRFWINELTYFERQGGELSIRLPNLPSVNISYAKSVQTKDSLNNDLTELMINGQYGYRIGNLSLSNSVIFNQNKGISNTADGVNYSVTNYLFNQLVSFSFPLSLSLNVNYINEQIRGNQSTLIFTDLSASVQLFKRLNVRLGGNYRSDVNNETKFGVFTNVDYAFAKYFTFRLSFDNNYYNDLQMINDRYNEYVLKTKLLVRW